MVRLDRRRSAVGSLVMTGAVDLVWESTDGVTGSVDASNQREGSDVITDGNRPLLDFDEGVALVTLRHIGRLRRGLVIGRDVDALGIRLYGGVTLSVPTPSGSPLVVMSLLVVDGRLELRAEPVAADLDAPAVHREFGFSMTHRFAFPSDGP